MTLSTGKRAFRACLRCRRRKTKCDLDGAGKPKKPPCDSCHRSGNECVLVESRRGRKTRSCNASKSAEQSSGWSVGVEDGGSVALAVSPISEHEDIRTLDIDEARPRGRMADEGLRMELRNPSDALEILARSDEAPLSDSEANRQLFPGTQTSAGAPVSAYSSSVSSTNSVADANKIRKSSNPVKQSSTVLENYDLVQRGVLHLSVLPELLQIYAQNYHAYCPIVPAYFLRQSALEQIQRSDYFLLTVLLTIASRDSPDHLLSHRYCWDHTERLLLDVVLARPWTQTPRTVEGLLLLSEWLPHIQSSQTTVDAPKNLFSEDRMTWSLIGLAIRQGYLLRLDRAAFRDTGDKEPKERVDQNRLLWHFICLADRQISVRLGQSFWSRGPSLSSQFTAKDFPSFTSTPGIKGEDYALVLQASNELTQILYNSHLILYSSTERTLAMVHHGDYARYLDDFLRAATSWYAVWGDIKVPQKIKSTILLKYEYVCLYVNAFSLQAVLTRSLAPPLRSQCRTETSRETLAGLFSRGIMSSPDGWYIYGAISAAMKLLSLMNDLDPRRVLCYLPSRYYLYGVYAAVFLHKTLGAGAFQTDIQEREVISKVLGFISVMEKASPIESHICHAYSKMLRNLWHQYVAQRNPPRDTCARPDAVKQLESTAEPTNSLQFSTSPSLAEEPRQKSGNDGSQGCWNSLLDTLGQDNDTPASLSVEGYLQGSFWPGLPELGHQDGLHGNSWDLNGPWMNGYSDLGFGLAGLES